MSAPTELVKGNVVMLILSSLARGPMHGYHIVKDIDEQSEGYFSMREGTLYPHLHQLERDGLIEGYWEATGGERRRRYYRITEHGKSELARKTQDWLKFRQNIDRLLRVAEEAGGA